MPGWYHLPATAASLAAETDTYKFFAQFMLALRERTWASSGLTYPQANAVWATTSASATLARNADGTWTLTDPTANWITGPTPENCKDRKQFFNFQCDELNFIPRYYDAICDSDNEREIVRCPIVGQPNATSVTLGNTIDDYVTAKCIPSAAWLDGRTWKFICRDGLWWTDRQDRLGRWLTWVGDQQVYAGDSAQPASVITLTPAATGAAWSPVSYVGKTLATGASGTPAETRTIYEGDATRATTDRFTTPPGGAIRIMDGADVIATGSVALVRDGLYDATIADASGSPTIKPAKVKDKELLVYGDGRLRRLAILDALPATLVFARQTFAIASGYWVVVNVNGCAFPGRAKPMPFAWYSGAPERIWGHTPNDELASTLRPANTVDWISGTIPFCPDDPSPHVAKDRDVWSDVQEECSPADYCYSPRLFKTWRTWQGFVLGLGPLFVAPRDYSGEASIPVLSPARHFALAGINWGTSTVSGNATIGYSFPVPALYNGSLIYWTVIGDDGDNFADGASGIAGGRVTVGTGDPLAGKSVIWSAGYTRKPPKHFARMRPATAFVNDYETKTSDSGITTLIVYDKPTVADFCCDQQDPPPDECCENCLGVGFYTKRGPSTGYSNYDGDGLAKDSEPFVAGDAARYIGDTFTDPGTNLVDAVFNSPGRLNGKDPTLPCFDRMFEGQHARPPFGDAQVHQVGDRAGGASGGTRFSLTIAGKGWWGDWFHGQTTKTHTGTLAAGGTTQVTLDAWTHDPHDERHCYFEGGRFVGFAAAFEGFVIEIDRVTPAADGVPASTTTHKMPLTGITNGVATLKYTASPAIAFETGDVWRIREAWKLNRYEACRAILLDPDTNARHVVTITHSDDDTVYFAPQAFTVALGWKLEILEYDTGGVWLFATSAPTAADAVYQKIADGKFWVKPTGDDPRGQPWRKDSTENEPHWFTKHGLLEKNDYVGVTLINELWKMIDVLRWTWRSLSWDSRAQADVPEENAGNGTGGNQDDEPEPSQANLDRGYYIDPGELTGDLDAQLANNLSGNGRNGGRSETRYSPPRVYVTYRIEAKPHEVSQSVVDSAFGGNAEVQARYAYAILSGVPTKLPVAGVQFAGFAQVDSQDSKPQKTIIAQLNQPYGNFGRTYDYTARSVVDFTSFAGTSYHKWTIFGSASGYAPEYRIKFGDASDMPVIDWSVPQVGDASGGEDVATGGCLISKGLALIDWQMSYRS